MCSVVLVVTKIFSVAINILIITVMFCFPVVTVAFGRRRVGASGLACCRHTTFRAKTKSAAEQFEAKVYNEFLKLEIPRNATILLCVSAGSDSMAMLHSLQAIKQSALPDLDLKVINFNHKVRLQSDQEVLFVHQVAQYYKLDFYSRSLTEELQAQRFTQELARKWRYTECKNLLDTFDSSRSSFVATAHHLDDQVESLLLKLLRGVHLTKLQISPTKNGKFIRPMLSFSKQELVDYLTVSNHSWMEDHSNQERDYKRNRVRLDLVPLMSDLAEGKVALYNRLLTLSQQSQWLEQQIVRDSKEKAKLLESMTFGNTHSLYLRNEPSDDVGGKPPLRSEFQTIPLLVLERIVYDWILAKTGVALVHAKSQKLIDAIFGPISRETRITISGDWDLVVHRNEILLELRCKSPMHDGPLVKNYKLVESGPTQTILRLRNLAVRFTHDSSISILMRPAGGEGLVDQGTRPAAVSEFSSLFGESVGSAISDLSDVTWTCDFDLEVPLESGESNDNDKTRSCPSIHYNIRPCRMKNDRFSVGTKELAIKDVFSKAKEATPGIRIYPHRTLVLTTNLSKDLHESRRGKLKKEQDRSVIGSAESNIDRILAILLHNHAIFSSHQNNMLKGKRTEMLSIRVRMTSVGSS